MKLPHLPLILGTAIVLSAGGGGAVYGLASAQSSDSTAPTSVQPSAAPGTDDWGVDPTVEPTVAIADDHGIHPVTVASPAQVHATPEAVHHHRQGGRVTPVASASSDDATAEPVETNEPSPEATTSDDATSEPTATSSPDAGEDDGDHGGGSGHGSDG